MPDAGTVEPPGLSDRPKFLQILGPGLITGASDDDPSGIATYSQVGAQFGYGLAWTMVLSYPLMTAIQEISARIGRVTGMGIAGNLRRHYPPWLGGAVVLLLLLANIINLGADLGAMGAALALLVPGPALIYVVLFGVLSAGLQIFVHYARYVAFLKYLCLATLGYVACAFVVHVAWADVAAAVVWPPISFDDDYLMAIVAVFGTTISPYLFFWQAEQEVEDENESPGAEPLVRAPEQARGEFRRIRIDTCIGMALSNVVGFFIIVTTAATLHAHGVKDIQTSAQAAEALRAVAGPFTFALFATCIIGCGMLTVPVLAASGAYALGEMQKWHVGLAYRLPRAKAFYATIVVSMLIGIALNFSPIDPIKALFWCAVINGVVAVPVMAVMMHLTMRPAVMGSFTLPRWLQGLGWLATIAMGATVVGLIWSIFT